MTAGGAGRPTAGIASMVAAMCLLASMDATAKWLVAEYAIAQILLLRFCVFLLLALVLAARAGFAASLRSRRPGLQLVRCLVMLAEIYVFVWAFGLLPLADVHGIAALSPLLAMALAVPLLGERVGWQRWAAVAVGFAGVAMIARPGTGVMGPAAAVPLCAALLWALLQVLIRKVGLVDSVATTSLYSAAVAVAVTAAAAPFVWRPPDAEGWGLMLLAGALGSLGHLLLFRALQLAPASALQPFGYVLVAWAAVMGFVVFGEFPDGWTLAGIAVVVASGLFAFNRERAASRSAR